MSRKEGVSEDERAGEAGRAGSAASVIGVLGAGTMGAGIAQLAARWGARALLYDPVPEALSAGMERIAAGLQKEAARAEPSADGRALAEEALARVQAVRELASLAPSELVIEAAPERLELKHELFGQLSGIVDERRVLATNTASLPVTAIAAGATHPARVGGLHFFNPAPVMRRLEVGAGAGCAGAAGRAGAARRPGSAGRRVPCPRRGRGRDRGRGHAGGRAARGGEEGGI